MQLGREALQVQLGQLDQGVQREKKERLALLVQRELEVLQEPQAQQEPPELLVPLVRQEQMD